MPEHHDRPEQHRDSEQNTTPKPTVFTTLATRSRLVWEQAWRQGGVLHRLWQDIRTAPSRGADMAHWLKALVILAGLSVVVLLADAAVSAIGHALGTLLSAAPKVDIGTDQSSGIWGGIDQPIRSYIAHHSAGMAVSGSTIYTLWQIAGLYGFIAGFAGSTIGRLVWTAWGAASAAAIWATVPGPQRTLSVAIAALVWGLASLFALRGLRLLPSIHIVNPAPTITPQIILPTQKDTRPDPDGFDAIGDTVQRPRGPRPF
ncbi:hypothetical protein ACIBL6_47635 [Streptomyces sp. NPDC050400]|uniref:hypothetical protein n=1 Tax=Streptomyces sp. NPDC050400 TaxID=3365610 RepID=UPI00378ABCCB